MHRRKRLVALYPTGNSARLPVICRIHGSVSSAPVQWRDVPSVQGTKLEEVTYHKSIGEGIAKVQHIAEHYYRHGCCSYMP